MPVTVTPWLSPEGTGLPCLHVMPHSHPSLHIPERLYPEAEDRAQGTVVSEVSSPSSSNREGGCHMVGHASARELVGFTGPRNQRHLVGWLPETPWHTSFRGKVMAGWAQILQGGRETQSIRDSGSVKSPRVWREEMTLATSMWRGVGKTRVAQIPPVISWGSLLININSFHCGS